MSFLASAFLLKMSPMSVMLFTAYSSADMPFGVVMSTNAASGAASFIPFVCVSPPKR